MRINHGVADRIEFAFARLRKRVRTLLALLEGGTFRIVFACLIENEGGGPGADGEGLGRGDFPGGRG